MVLSQVALAPAQSHSGGDGRDYRWYDTNGEMQHERTLLESRLVTQLESGVEAILSPD